MAQDKAVVAVTELLFDAAAGSQGFAFVPEALRQQAQAALCSAERAAILVFLMRLPQARPR